MGMKINRIFLLVSGYLWIYPMCSGDDGEIFTGVLPNGYGPPGGYCFDITCGPDMIKVSPGNNQMVALPFFPPLNFPPWLKAYNINVVYFYYNWLSLYVFFEEVFFFTIEN